jgi:hypothetical protein
VAAHGGLLLDDSARSPVDVLGRAIRGRAAGDEEGLEEAVRAEPDFRDEPPRTAQTLHCLCHLLRRRVATRRIVRMGHRRRRRRHRERRRLPLRLLHLGLSGLRSATPRHTGQVVAVLLAKCPAHSNKASGPS